MPAPDDDPGCRPRGGADLSRHRRCASPVPKIQVSRGGGWADVLQGSIRRGRLERQNIALWRWDDADDAHEAAQGMVHSKKWSWLQAGAMQIARPRGIKKAIVSLARRLALVLDR